MRAHREPTDKEILHIHEDETTWTWVDHAEDTTDMLVQTVDLSGQYLVSAGLLDWTAANYILVHPAKTDELFIDRFRGLLANTTLAPCVEPFSGPFDLPQTQWQQTQPVDVVEE